MSCEQSSTFLGLQWQPHRAPCVKVTLISMHGDADVFTTQSREFGLTAADCEQAQVLLACLDLLADAVGVHLDGSTEDICGYIASRLPPQLQRTEEELFALLDDFVRCDATYDELIAKPVAYVVEHVQPDGRLQRASFNGCGYKTLWPIASVYLSDWA